MASVDIAAKLQIRPGMTIAVLGVPDEVTLDLPAYPLRRRCSSSCATGTTRRPGAPS